jgi:hypothetical protein
VLGIRPLHLALALSGALTCLMAGLLAGIVMGGGHVTHALSVIRGAPAPARASTRPGATPATLTTTVVRTARSGAGGASTVTVTRTGPGTTVTQPASTVTVSGPPSTVTETVTVTQTGSSTASTGAP